MCRFLIVKSDNKFDPGSLLAEFVEMCRHSKTLDGDRQADGFGIAWLQSSRWQTFKGLYPVWEQTNNFTEIPETSLLVAHARSATFKDKTGNVEYNQPYINSNGVFVFNGHLKGVSLPFKVEGEVGAQKIWSLIERSSNNKVTYQSLQEFYKLIKENTNEIVGMNIGVVTDDDVFILSDGSNQDDYFTLKKADIGDKLIICSDKIGDIEFENLSRGEVLHYN